MKTEQALLVTAFLTFTVAPVPPVLAQNCSGGPDGGLDATGNECSVSTPAANELDAALWTMIASRMAIPANRAPAVVATQPAVPENDARPVAAPLPQGPGAGDLESSRSAAR